MEAPFELKNYRGRLYVFYEGRVVIFFKLSKIALVNSYYTHSSAAIFKPRYIRKGPHSGQRTTEVEAPFELKDYRGRLYVFYEGRVVIFFKLSKIALVNSYYTHSSAAIFKPRYIRKGPHSGQRTTEVDPSLN